MLLSNLIGYGVRARRAPDDVVEAVRYGGVLHDVTGVDDIRACGRDLNLDQIALTADLWPQTHSGQQLSDAFCWFTEKQRRDCDQASIVWTKLRKKSESLMSSNERFIMCSLDANSFVDEVPRQRLCPVRQLLKSKSTVSRLQNQIFFFKATLMLF